MAAELIAAGIDVHDIYRRLYEGDAAGQARAARARADRRAALRRRPADADAPDRDDYASTGADESYSEGVVDHLRSVAGHRRGGRSSATCSRPTPPASARSRCAPPTTASTSRGSRAPRAAAAIAGPRGSRPTWSSASWSTSCARKLPTSSPSRRARPRRADPRRQGARHHLPRRGRAGPAAARARGQGRPRRDARPVRDGPAARARGAGDPRAAVRDGAAQALRGRRPARLDLDDRGPRGRARAGPDPGGAADAAHGTGPPAPAGALGRQDRRRAGLPAGAPRRGRRAGRARGARAPLRRALARRGARGVRDRVRVGDLRALAGRGPRRRVLPASCAAPRSAPSTSPPPIPERIVPLGRGAGVPPGGDAGEPTRRGGPPTGWPSTRRGRSRWRTRRSSACSTTTG